MHFILSINTATPVVSVALHQAGKLITAIEHHMAKSHSKLLPNMISHLLSLPQINMQQLSAIAVSAGPGSYTGLRVGVALAKGLCYGTNLPLISIDTLLTIVQSQLTHPLQKGVYCPLLTTSGQYVYALITDVHGHPLTKIHKCTIQDETLVKWLKKGPVYFIGTDIEKYAQVIDADPNAYFIKGIYPKASYMGKPAYVKFLKKDFVKLATFQPLY